MIQTHHIKLCFRQFDPAGSWPHKCTFQNVALQHSWLWVSFQPAKGVFRETGDPVTEKMNISLYLVSRWSTLLSVVIVVTGMYHHSILLPVVETSWMSLNKAGECNSVTMVGTNQLSWYPDHRGNCKNKMFVLCLDPSLLTINSKFNSLADSRWHTISGNTHVGAHIHTRHFPQF